VIALLCKIYTYISCIVFTILFIFICSGEDSIFLNY